MWMGRDWSKYQSSDISGVSGTEVAECRKKVASGRKVAGVIRSPVNA